MHDQILRNMASAIVVLCFIAPVHAQKYDPDLFSVLKYRHVGPVGNRVIAVTGIADEPHTYYAGSASGGIFKTTDGGIHWDPIFDDQDVGSIGSIAIAPSDENVIWAGTGETFIRSNISIGNGIYKSTDKGKTWKKMGLEKTGRIGRIVIDPDNPDRVFAAAMGHCYGPQQERGVYRTLDGGETWERVLFVDENTGSSDIAMDPNNPRILFAGMWQVEIKTWLRDSGGPGSGIFVSRDSGDTWNRLEGHGLPGSPLGKIGIAIAPSDSNRIYALIETAQYDFEGVLWRSDDGGEEWSLVSYDNAYHQRPFYYTRCAVDPNNADIVYFIAEGIWESHDGGKTASRIDSVGGDDHDMWINPVNPQYMIVANDGGAPISVNGGKTWHKPKLPIAQMYHVAVDNEIPYNLYGNRQDGGTYRGPSNSRTRGGIPAEMWYGYGGNESGFSVPDPVDNKLVWAGRYDGGLDFYDGHTNHVRNVNRWPDDIDGWPAAPLKYRFNWTYPIVVSPHDHNTVYIASQYVHVTTDRGHSWREISPDLTLNDKSKQGDNGGLVVDNIGTFFGCNIFALAESPLEQGVLWAGSNDGLVHITRDGGKTWDNVTGNIPGLPEWGTISNIHASKYEPGTCYITVDFHQMNNRDPYVYKGTDYGKRWELISTDIPKSMHSYAHCVREDPKRKGMLYLGTENAIYVTFDDGANWIPLQNNLPHAPVHWIEIQDHFSDLVIATYGRGFWIMDDLTPLRQFTKDVEQSDAFLFEPRFAYRFQNIPGIAVSWTMSTLGENPPYGAGITYYLKSETQDDVSISILDENGKEVRTLDGTKNTGMNRVYWDLRHESAETVKLRTPPLGHPGVEHGPERLRYNDEGWRPLVTWGSGGDKGPLVIPGTYAVKLKVGDEEYTRTLEVRKDPNTAGTNEEITAQTNMLLELRANIDTVVEMINSIEHVRKQIDDMGLMFKDEGEYEEIVSAVDELDKKCIAVEEKLFLLQLTGRVADAYRGAPQLYSKLMSLASTTGQGDYPPTTQAIEVHSMFKEMLADYEERFHELMETSVAEFNEMMKDKGLLNIVVPQQ